MIHQQRLVIATHNHGKLKEFSALLAPYFKNIVSAGELGLPEPEETGETFTDNALLKARAAATEANCIALADDSGLCVNALHGAPGIYSGRYAETPQGRDFLFAMQKLNQEMGSNPDRSAYFICVLALVWPDERSEIFEGRLQGIIAPAPKGSNGHGYDPIFIPQGKNITCGEMSPEEKNAISHRAVAVRHLIAWLKKETP
jgi:XTP/dITP diphosphohydrolase